MKSQCGRNWRRKVLKWGSFNGVISTAAPPIGQQRILGRWATEAETFARFLLKMDLHRNIIIWDIFVIVLTTFSR